MEVLRVTRKGTEAVHFVKQSFAIGTEVKVKVDWQRRWDHMQQHSGIKNSKYQRICCIGVSVAHVPEFFSYK